MQLLGLAGPRAPAAISLVSAISFALPVLAWSVRQVLDAEPDEQVHLSTLAVGGPVREVVAGLSFDAALARFVDAANALRAAYYADRFPGMEFATLDVRMGKRYAAIWSGTCIYTFVDTLTGDILKPKTWKGPELKNPRGNVFDTGCISAVTAHGTASLR